MTPADAADTTRDGATIRIVLPAHLRELAKVDGEVEVRVDGPVTQTSVLDALESAHPVLVGRVRDHNTGRRRGFVRFYACQEDLSHESPDDPLPAPVVAGDEPFLIVGSMAGG
jgi:molybdopterin synthase sulfur carrier subunit